MNDKIIFVDYDTSRIKATWMDKTYTGGCSS